MGDNGQNNHNEEMSADQVWLSLLEDLKQTPLEIPETWPKETKAHWDSEELSLVVTIPDDIDEVWLDRRFLPLAKIYFSEEHKEKQFVLQRQGREGVDDLLVRVQSSVYEEITEPNKIVPVQIYLFHHWLPVLGASPFWVVTGMKQVSFVAISKENSVLKPISTRMIAKWTPLGFAAVAKCLNKGGFSSWFYKKIKDSYEDVPPEYNVWSQIPVAPHHLSWIEDYFKQHAEEESATAILESLIDRTVEIRRVKPGEMKIPSFYSNKRRTVINVVSKYFPGKISQDIYALVTQLEQQITRPNLAITIPHYFFKKFLGDLNSNEAALIWYLRSLYKEDESTVIQFTGYTPISESLGCGRNTPQRMLDNCILSQEDNRASSWDPHYQPDLPLRNWLAVDYLSEHVNGTARAYTISIRPAEPIHTDDKAIYTRRLQQMLESFESNNEPSLIPTQNDTGDEQNDIEGKNIPAHNNTGGAQKYIGVEEPPTQNNTGPAQIDTGGAQKDTGPTRNKTGYPHKTEHLNSLNINDSLTDSFNDSLIPPLPGTNDPDLSTNQPVVGVREINLEKLLGFGSYKHTEKKKLVELIEKNQELFLAWFIRNHITVAKFPVRLAVKNIQEGNVTEDQYLELATLGWGITAQLASVNENDLSMWGLGVYEENEDQEDLIQVYKKLSKTAKKEMEKLRETGYSEIFENVMDKQ